MCIVVLYCDNCKVLPVIRQTDRFQRRLPPRRRWLDQTRRGIWTSVYYNYYHYYHHHQDYCCCCCFYYYYHHHHCYHYYYFLMWLIDTTTTTTTTTIDKVIKILFQREKKFVVDANGRHWDKQNFNGIMHWMNWMKTIKSPELLNSFQCFTHLLLYLKKDYWHLLVFLSLKWMIFISVVFPHALVVRPGKVSGTAPPSSGQQTTAVWSLLGIRSCLFVTVWSGTRCVREYI